MNASTTCTFSDPLNFEGEAPLNHAEHFQYSSMACDTYYASTTDLGIINGFTQGEILNGYFLFGILLALAYAIFHFWIRGVKVKE